MITGGDGLKVTLVEPPDVDTLAKNTYSPWLPSPHAEPSNAIALANGDDRVTVAGTCPVTSMNTCASPGWNVRPNWVKNEARRAVVNARRLYWMFAATSCGSTMIRPGIA